MNRALVGRLILKDWYLSRLTLALVAAGGSVSIGVVYVGGSLGFIGLLTSLMTTIFLSILLPTTTIVNERKNHNLAFVMSLPISPMEYTAAKVLGNLSAFLVLWAIIAISVIVTIARAGPFGGVIPLATMAALSPFVTFCLLTAVSIVVESEMWAMITMGASNCAYSFWFLLFRIPGFSENMKSPVPIWSRPVLLILAGQITVIVAALVLTFYLQSRKRDFV